MGKLWSVSKKLKIKPHILKRDSKDHKLPRWQDYPDRSNLCSPFALEQTEMKVCPERETLNQYNVLSNKQGYSNEVFKSLCDFKYVKTYFELTISM